VKIKYYGNIWVITFILCFIGNLLYGQNENNNSGIVGFWQGPHPELKHVNFIFHIYESPDRSLIGKGYWVDHGLYHAEFPINRITFKRRDVAVKISDWGCVYKGRLARSNDLIRGGFQCLNEPPDKVIIKRVKKENLYGLFPEHLNSSNDSFTYHYKKPEQIDDDISTSSLVSSSLNPDVVSEIVRKIALGSYGRIHSFLIIKNGQLVCEEYFFGFNRDILHPLESATKSITSLLMGIAFEQNKNANVNDNISQYFPEFTDSLYEENPVMVKHLLTMTSGFLFDENGMLHSPERLSFLLHSKRTASPGEKFIYSAGNTELLGGIIKKLSGKYADEFAREYLFEPLKINNFNWNTYNNNGYPLCGGALWLKPRDMAKIGLLVLNNGKWQGRQIIPESWIEKSTIPHIKTGIGTDSYGYQWWVSDIHSHSESFKLIWANGLGSQFIFIFPELKMVIVTTGGNWVGGNDGRSWDICNLFRDYLHLLVE